MKNETAVTLKLSLNIVGNSNDTTNFLHKFLLNSDITNQSPDSFLSDQSVSVGE